MRPGFNSDERYLILVDQDDDGDVQEILTVISEGRAILAPSWAEQTRGAP